MRSIAIFVFLGLIGCASANNETASFPYPPSPPPKYGIAYNVQWLGVKLVLENCRLLNKVNDETILLYHFKDETECHFMKGQKKEVRKFTTYDGRNIIPVGLSTEANKDSSCTTKAISLLVKGKQVFISNLYYLRYQCKGFNWPEKPFHVIADPEALHLLPSEDIQMNEL